MHTDTVLRAVHNHENKKTEVIHIFFIVDGQTASKNRNRHNNVFIYIFFDNYSCTQKAQIFPLYELIF